MMPSPEGREKTFRWPAGVGCESGRPEAAPAGRKKRFDRRSRDHAWLNILIGEPREPPSKLGSCPWSAPLKWGSLAGQLRGSEPIPPASRSPGLPKASPNFESRFSSLCLCVIVVMVLSRAGPQASLSPRLAGDAEAERWWFGKPSLSRAHPGPGNPTGTEPGAP